VSPGTSGPRRTSKRVAESPGCLPLRQAYSIAASTNVGAWEAAEDVFLRAMEGFDDNVVAGVANQGDIQNGKGDFFNDLLALLLENCAGIELSSRSGVPGLIFPTHNLDVTFPTEGLVQFLVEAKAVGIPKHPRNQRQRNPLGRPGSADLLKRVKEAAFKTIDLKAEYGRIRVASGDAAAAGPGGNLTTWLRENKPRSYLFIASRVVDGRDLNAVFKLARAAAQVMDGVGVYAFGPVRPEQPTSYRPIGVPRDIELAAVLFRACQDIKSVGGPEMAPAQTAPGPAAEAAELLDFDDVDVRSDDED
jgi:hypothetical protein